MNQSRSKLCNSKQISHCKLACIPIFYSSNMFQPKDKIGNITKPVLNPYPVFPTLLFKRRRNMKMKTYIVETKKKDD